MLEQYGTIIEKPKDVPVVADVDVVVAGSGCAGLFAAIAAAEEGASTLLVERLGLPGGNAGPGMVFGCVSPLSEGFSHLPEGNRGAVREFEERMEKMRGNSPESRLIYSSLFSCVALQMLEERGVKLMLSAYASDPIIENGAAKGLFVETKSGRVAVLGKTLIDATGDGDLAMRAGVKMARKCPEVDRFQPPIVERYLKDVRPKWSQENWNELGIVFVIGGIDWGAYRSFCGDAEPVSPIGLARPRPGEPSIPLRNKFPGKVYERLKTAAEIGEYEFSKELKNDAVVFWQYRMIRSGADTAESAITVLGDVETDNFEHVTLLESAVRRHAYDSVGFLRRHVHGCENAYLLCMSSFLGARGGPHVEGDVTLYPTDIIGGSRFDDVVSRAIFEAEVYKKEGKHPQAQAGYDLPYRMLLPVCVDGMLVVGRAAAYYRRGHDPATRGRIVMYRLGQVAGMASAQAAREGKHVRDIDKRTLQRRLLREGFFLGEPERLKALGLDR